jgi:hypothetical protein
MLLHVDVMHPASRVEICNTGEIILYLHRALNNVLI